MRDKTHMEQVERWAHYVKEHPAQWKKEHTAFIDSVYRMACDAIWRLSQQPGGREKIITLRGIKNTKGYPTLLGGKFTDLKPFKGGNGTEHVSEQVDETLYGD
ncbi:hypothetical protein HY497_00850 [Candidatus Woesearchaeota archaeon]|nr:hypothetical protein [Candidatus Woesearchaeota archaeon]